MLGSFLSITTTVQRITFLKGMFGRMYVHTSKAVHSLERGIKGRSFSKILAVFTSYTFPGKNV